MIYFDAAYIAKCYLNEPARIESAKWLMAQTASHRVSWPDSSLHRYSNGMSESIT